jgi:hypothetical protein
MTEDYEEIHRPGWGHPVMALGYSALALLAGLLWGVL